MVSAHARCRPELLGELLDESLSPEQTLQLTEHLADCESCQQRLESIAAAPQLWRETRMVLADPTIRAQSTAKRDQAPPQDHAADATLEDDSRQRLRSLLPMLEPPSQAGSLGRIDHYHIRAIVGWGGMGVVLQAYDESLGRTVALKILHPHLAAHGAARRRFAREARAAAAVNHPSVVPIHSVQADSHPPYLVMAYVPGGSLQDRIDREGPLETTDLLRIGIQIADALAAAHAQGLVHRDVKPGNILLDHGQNRVLLSDFGLAQALDDATLTASGALAGTPQYMSPEQSRGEAIDARSDLFSLGGVLYAMACGRPPFRAGSTLAVLQKIGTADPKPLSEIVPEAPPWLQALIDRLQAKQPDERPQSASEVADWLRQSLAHARRPQEESLPAALLPAKPPTEPASVGSTGVWPLRATVLLLPLLVVTSIAAWWLWSGGRDQRTESVSVDAPSSHHVSEPIPFTPLPSDVTRWDDGLDDALSELDRVLDGLED